MDEWIKKMWYIHTLEYSALKKEENPTICVNMDEPRGHYAKWSKSETERQILYDIACMWNLKTLNL